MTGERHFETDRCAAIDRERNVAGIRAPAPGTGESNVVIDVVELEELRDSVTATSGDRCRGGNNETGSALVVDVPDFGADWCAAPSAAFREGGGARKRGDSAWVVYARRRQD